LFAILLFIEAMTFNLITIWFAVGAIGAFITTYFTGDVVIQCLVFTLVAVMSLLFTRPIVRRLVNNRGHVKTNLDSVVGEIGIVDIEIKRNALGRITVLGKDWAAKSDSTIKVGSKVKVLAIEGVKVIVRKMEDK
jgi:membrane protein implicated in regulation of membrane protease activity